MLRFFFLAFFFITSSSFLLAKGNHYVISGIEVDVTSTDVKKAQADAFEEGKKEAFQKLLEKLTGQEEIPLTLSPEQLTSFVSSHVVESEKRSKVRYIAKLTFNFNKSKVEGFLNSKGMDFNSEELKPVLLIPMLRKEDKDLLWEEENTWLQEWEKAPLSKTSISFELPEANLQDIQDLSPHEALTQNASEILKLVNRYDTHGAVILHQIDETIKAWFISPAGEVSQVPLILKESSETSKDTQPSVFEEILQELGKFIKGQLATENAAKAHLKVIVHVKDQAEWILTQKSLQLVPIVRKVKVESLSPKKVEVMIDYVGSLETLQESLAKQELTLRPSAKGDWTLLPNTFNEKQAVSSLH